MPPIEQIHPMIVHFPIVLIIALAVLDLFAIWRGVPLGGRNTYATFAVVTAIAAGAAALLASTFGDSAAEIATSRGVSAALIATHETLGSTAAMLFAVWAVVRGFFWWKSVSLTGTRAVLVGLVDVALVGLVITVAYYGGQLVFEHGINVMPAAG